jgi:1-deoxy-D-xylulose-5-phosphate synthase
MLAPKDGAEFDAMLRYIVQDHVTGRNAGPIAIRYPRGNAPSIDWADRRSGSDRLPKYQMPPIEFGKAETILRGDDVALLAYGNMVAPAFEAAKNLRAEGIDAAFVNLRWAKPLDRETILDLARRVRRLIVIEEGVVDGGVGSAILELLAAQGLSDVQVKLFGVPDKFIEHGAIPILHRLCMLTAPDFEAAARDMLGRPQPEPEPLSPVKHESLTA